MDRSLRCWDLAKGECVGTITSVNEGHTEAITTLEPITVQGTDYVMSGGADSMLKVWGMAGNHIHGQNQGAVITALKTSFDALGNRIIVAMCLDRIF